MTRKLWAAGMAVAVMTLGGCSAAVPLNLPATSIGTSAGGGSAPGAVSQGWIGALTGAVRPRPPSNKC